MSIINVYLGIVTTGCSLRSKILNLSLTREDRKKSIYIENNSINKKDLNEENLNLFNNQILKNNNDNVFSNFNDIIICKCEEYKIPDYIIYYLNEISDEDDIIIFHSLHPIDWFFFLNIGFKIDEKLEIPILDKRICQYPKDFLGHLFIGDLDSSEVDKLMNNTLNYNKNDFDSNSLIQSFVLKEKFKMIENFKEE